MGASSLPHMWGYQGVDHRRFGVRNARAVQVMNLIKLVGYVPGINVKYGLVEVAVGMIGTSVALSVSNEANCKWFGDLAVRGVCTSVAGPALAVVDVAVSALRICFPSLLDADAA